MQSYKETEHCFDDCADLSLLVANPPNLMALDWSLTDDSKNWLFVTISIRPTTIISKLKLGEKLIDKHLKIRRYNNLSLYDQYKVSCLYFAKVYGSTLRGLCYGTYELNKAGLVHLHVLVKSLDPVNKYTLTNIRQNVRSHIVTMAIVGRGPDFMNNICAVYPNKLSYSDDNATTILKYMCKDDDEKLEVPNKLPKRFYFIWE